MKELYYEYFYIPRHGRIREKVMLVRVALTAVIMILCLFAICFSAYAFFSHSITSDSNIIKSADFNALVTVTHDDSDAGVTPTTGGEYELSNGKYKVELVKSGSASTGFCILEIKAESGAVIIYHTAQLGNDGDETRNEMSFVLDLTAIPNGVDITLRITPHWGTSSMYGYTYSNERYITPELESVAVVYDPGVGAADELDNADEETIAETVTEVTTVPDETTAVPEDTGEDTTVADETTTAEIIYTVKDGDVLSSIASMYKVSLDKLVAYNNIEDPDNIYGGQLIKIPPDGWVIPSDTTETQAE